MKRKNASALLQTVTGPKFPDIEEDPVFYSYTVTMGLSENRQVSCSVIVGSGK